MLYSLNFRTYFLDPIFAMTSIVVVFIAMTVLMAMFVRVVARRVKTTVPFVMMVIRAGIIKVVFAAVMIVRWGSMIESRWIILVLSIAVIMPIALVMTQGL